MRDIQLVHITEAFRQMKVCLAFTQGTANCSPKVGGTLLIFG